MTVLSVDPGRSDTKATIGYCLFTRDGEEIERGEMNWSVLTRRLQQRLEYGENCLYFDDHEIKRVVIEDFVNDPRVKRGGQRNGASEVIGAVEFMCAQTEASFVRRDRNTLTAAKLHAGYVQTHAHLPHADSAFVHGYSDFVMRGIVPARGVADTLD